MLVQVPACLLRKQVHYKAIVLHAQKSKRILSHHCMPCTIAAISIVAAVGCERFSGGIGGSNQTSLPDVQQGTYVAVSYAGPWLGQSQSDPADCGAQEGM